MLGTLLTPAGHGERSILLLCRTLGYPTDMGIRSLIPTVLVVLASSPTVLAQAYPSGLPTEKPTVYDGKQPPKEDKSRLRDLTGVVKDNNGAPIAGAIVQIKDGRTGRLVDFITKQDGSYAFYALNMDIDYDLSAKRDGFDGPVKKRLSKYDSRKPATLNFELQKKEPPSQGGKESGKVERPSKD